MGQQDYAEFLSERRYRAHTQDLPENFGEEAAACEQPAHSRLWWRGRTIRSRLGGSAESLE
jgi:hypothetical protein